MAAGGFTNLGESEHGNCFVYDVKEGKITCLNCFEELDGFFHYLLFNFLLGLDFARSHHLIIILVV